MLRPKKEEVIRGHKNVHNEVHDFVVFIVQVYYWHVKPMGMTLTGHVARMVKTAMVGET